MTTDASAPVSALELLPGFTLDALLPSDLEAVTVIEAAAQITPWSQRLFADCLSSGYWCQVVRHQQRVVAFQVLSFVLDESHLLNIAVAPALQRRGIARALLQHTLIDVRQRGIRQLFLEVRASNARAQALYLSLGFSHYSDRKNYYRTASGHEDAWLMLRDL